MDNSDCLSWSKTKEVDPIIRLHEMQMTSLYEVNKQILNMDQEDRKLLNTIWYRKYKCRVTARWIAA